MNPYQCSSFTAAARNAVPEGIDEARLSSGGYGLPIVGLNEDDATHLCAGACASAQIILPTTATAKEIGGADYYSSGLVAGRDLPAVVAQVTSGPDPPAAVIGSFAERMGGGLPILGLAVAGLAATGLTTGVASPWSPPVTAFSMFLMLLGGLSLVTIHVLRA